MTLRNDDTERYRLYRLCPCETCSGVGKVATTERGPVRCADCRGEGRARQIVATANTAVAVGVALVTLGMEGEWEDCPFGLLDTEGEVGRRWLVSPWLPSPRNVSDAARLLGSARKGER